MALGNDINADLTLGIRGRGYTEPGLYSKQDKRYEIAGEAELDLSWQPSNDHYFKMLAFGRLDEASDELTHADWRELYWRGSYRDYSLLIGYQQVFWGVSESRHLVDTINQIDFLQNIDGEDKLGQPMVSASARTDLGEFEVYWLPVFVERAFPAVEDRFSLPLAVENTSEFPDISPHSDKQYALRYSHYWEAWDYGIHYFYGLSREPVLVSNGDGLTPYYYEMQQFGVDLQYTEGAWLLKGEAIYRKTQDDPFLAMVGGFEYTLFGVREGNTDLGLLAEYLYDDRNEDQPATFLDNDLFIATRWALNDVKDTTLLVGLYQDIESSERLLSLEASTRITNHFRVDLEARWFESDGDTPIRSFEQDDYIEINISYYL